MVANQKQHSIIRGLAKKTKEISQDPIHTENIKRWKNKNRLIKGRPLIMCSPPQAAWEEIIPSSEIISEDPLLKMIEIELRRRIYHYEHFKDDWPITDTLFVPLSKTISDWMDGHIRPYSSDAKKAAAIEPCMNNDDGIEKMRFPKLTVDKQTSNKNYEIVCDLLGDILTVELGAPYITSKGWGESLIDEFLEMRGMEQLFMDLYTNPKFVHEVMSFMMNGLNILLDQLEKEHALFLNNRENSIGTLGLGYLDDLPGQNFDPSKIVTQNLWGYAQAQDFSSVSPDMLEEFVLPYQAKLLERFGLNGYGCCEPNDKKWGIIKKHIPNLRSLSVSAFANHETAAGAIKDEYVYVWKPHPYQMIGKFDEKYIADETKRVFEITKDCHVVVNLMDTQTLYGEPERLDKWVQITKEVALHAE